MAIQIDSANRSSEIIGSVDGLEAFAAALQLLVDGIEPSLGEASANPSINTIQNRLLRLEDTLGSVLTSPGANTVQGRLKTIQDTLIAILNSNSRVTTLVSTSQPLVTTTATVLVAAATTTKSVRIQNDSTSVVYVGHGATVSPTQYVVKLNPGDGASFDHAGDIYGVIASGTGATVQVARYS